MTWGYYYHIGTGTLLYKIQGTDVFFSHFFHENTIPYTPPPPREQISIRLYSISHTYLFTRSRLRYSFVE
jgi:hypothetical protein